MKIAKYLKTSILVLGTLSATFVALGRWWCAACGQNHSDGYFCPQNQCGFDELVGTCKYRHPNHQKKMAAIKELIMQNVHTGDDIAAVRAVVDKCERKLLAQRERKQERRSSKHPEFSRSDPAEVSEMVSAGGEPSETGELLSDGSSEYPELPGAESETVGDLGIDS